MVVRSGRIIRAESQEHEMTDLASPGNRTSPSGSEHARALHCVPLRGNLVLARFPELLQGELGEKAQTVWLAGGEAVPQAAPGHGPLSFRSVPSCR